MPATSELVRRAIAQATALVRAEMALAKLELAVRARRYGLGAGLFGTAVVLVLHAVAVLLVVIVAALHLVWPLWLAALVVTAVLLTAVAVLVLFGRSQLGKAAPPTPGEAIAGVRTDIATVAEAARRAKPDVRG